MLAKSAHTWRFLTAAPPREVFAVMEQLVGTRPYRFEVIDDETARIVERRRRGVFGTWSTPRLFLRWVTCQAVATPNGTEVRVEASSGGGLFAKALGKADRGPISRALQIVHLLSEGVTDARTIYRERRIPPGPVTLVASWAGTPYRLFAEPRFDAPRGQEILTATEVVAVPGGNGPFVKVRLGDGAEGFVERDQLVASPSVATRDAQAEAARYV